MSARTKRRRKAERRGRWAESLCLWSLRLRGYRILARDYRVGVGEVISSRAAAARWWRSR
ncbi:MAG TPA: hypothetical protein VH137_07290 [Gemmatimonadales bacterium]|nr:hypothetical protein [Gemmatimonadales bacterium]